MSDSVQEHAVNCGLEHESSSAHIYRRAQADCHAGRFCKLHSELHVPYTSVAPQLQDHARGAAVGDAAADQRLFIPWAPPLEDDAGLVSWDAGHLLQACGAVGKLDAIVQGTGVRGLW